MGIPCKRSCGCKTALLVMKEADIVKEISDYHKISESNALRNQSAQWNDRRFGIPSLLLNDMQSKHHGLKLMCLGTGIFFPYVAQLLELMQIICQIGQAVGFSTTWLEKKHDPSFLAGKMAKFQSDTH